MHPQFLINLIDHVPLALLSNKTIDDGCIPQDWKMVYVSQIFNPIQDRGNFSPVTPTDITISSKHFPTFSFNPFSNFKFEVMITYLTEMLKFLNFGRMATSTT